MSGYGFKALLVVDEDGQILDLTAADTARTTSTLVLPIQVVQADGSVPVFGSLVDENGVEYGVKHIGNKPRVSAMPYLFDIAEGSVANHYALHKTGHNDAVGAALETVWPGSAIYPYMAAADQLEILSSDDEDGGAGGDTGALTMTIYGLDTNYDEINEAVTLNGTTVVTTTASFLRVFSVVVNTAGSLGWNKGNITVRDQDTDTTRALLPATFNRSLMAVWTVPAGHTAYVVDWYVSSAVAKVVEAGIFLRPENEVFSPEHYVDFISGQNRHNFQLPLKALEKSDIEIRARAGGGGGQISGGFALWYEAN